MTLKPLGNNMVELTLKDNIKVLFSYHTPVAVKSLKPTGTEYYVTSTFYNRITSKRINEWMPKENRINKPQSWFNELVGMCHDR